MRIIQNQSARFLPSGTPPAADPLGAHPARLATVEAYAQALERECTRPVDPALARQSRARVEAASRDKRAGTLWSLRDYLRADDEMVEAIAVPGPSDDPRRNFRRAMVMMAATGAVRLPYELLRLPAQGSVVLGRGATLGARVALAGGRWVGVKGLEMRTEGYAIALADLAGGGRPQIAPNLQAAPDLHQDAVRSAWLLALYDALAAHCTASGERLPARMIDALAQRHQAHREAVAAARQIWSRQAVAGPLDVAKTATDFAVLGSGPAGLATVAIQAVSPLFEEPGGAWLALHQNTKYAALTRPGQFVRDEARREATPPPVHDAAANGAAEPAAADEVDADALRNLWIGPAQIRMAYVTHAAKSKLAHLVHEIASLDTEVCDREARLRARSDRHLDLLIARQSLAREAAALARWTEVVAADVAKSLRDERAFLKTLAKDPDVAPDGAVASWLATRITRLDDAIARRLDTWSDTPSARQQIGEALGDGAHRLHGMHREAARLQQRIAEIDAQIARLDGSAPATSGADAPVDARRSVRPARLGIRGVMEYVHTEPETIRREISAAARALRSGVTPPAGDGDHDVPAMPSAESGRGPAASAAGRLTPARLARGRQDLYQAQAARAEAVARRKRLEDDLVRLRNGQWQALASEGLIGRMLTQRGTRLWKSARSQAEQHHVSATSEYMRALAGQALPAGPSRPYALGDGDAGFTVELGPYLREHEEHDSKLRRLVLGTLSRAKKRAAVLDGGRAHRLDRQIKERLGRHRIAVEAADAALPPIPMQGPSGHRLPVLSGSLAGSRAVSREGSVASGLGRADSPLAAVRRFDTGGGEINRAFE